MHYSNCSHTQAPDVRNPLKHSLSTPQTKCLKKFLRQASPNWIYLYVLLISIDVSVMWVYIEFQMCHFPVRWTGGICFSLSPARWIRTFSAHCGFALVLMDHKDCACSHTSHSFPDPAPFSSGRLGRDRGVIGCEERGNAPHFTASLKGRLDFYICLQTPVRLWSVFHVSG